MKRKNNLYQNLYKLENVESAFDEVCRNTKNKKRVYEAKSNRAMIIGKVVNTLKNCSYIVGKYNHFVIYEPKMREIVSQGIFDKIVNHLVAREIIYSVIEKSLEDFNVASRKEKGTKKALELYKNARDYYSKYKKYYVLKCDIYKFFASLKNF